MVKFFAVLRMVLLMVQTQTYRGSSPTVHFPIKYCGYYQSTVEREEGEREKVEEREEREEREEGKEGKAEKREEEAGGDSSLPNNQHGSGLKVPGDGVHIWLQFLRFIGSSK